MDKEQSVITAHLALWFRIFMMQRTRSWKGNRTIERRRKRGHKAQKKKKENMRYERRLEKGRKVGAKERSRSSGGRP